MAVSESEATAIQQRFAELRRQEYQISQRIANLESERSEHDLVLSVVSKMDGDRKCYQLIGGILVERSIEMVIPDLTYKREAITTVIGQLQKEMEVRTTESNQLQKTFGATAGSVSTRGGDGKSSEPRAASSKGVLVGS